MTHPKSSQSTVEHGWRRAHEVSSPPEELWWLIAISEGKDNFLQGCGPWYIAHTAPVHIKAVLTGLSGLKKKKKEEDMKSVRRRRE